MSSKGKCKYLWTAGLGFVSVSVAIQALLPTWYHKRLNRQLLHDLAADKTIILTFDDGPDPHYTGRLLDLLQQYQVKAVFFVVLAAAEQNEVLIERMLREGHVVGIHSIRHASPMLQGFLATGKEFQAYQDFFDHYGIRDRYYRPPWGHANVFTAFYLKKTGIRMMLWSAMADDWRWDATPESIGRLSRQRVGRHGILCLHDAGENSGGASGAPEKMLGALRELLPEWQAQRYRFAVPCAPGLLLGKPRQALEKPQGSPGKALGKWIVSR